MLDIRGCLVLGDVIRWGVVCAVGGGTLPYTVSCRVPCRPCLAWSGPSPDLARSPSETAAARGASPSASPSAASRQSYCVAWGGTCLGVPAVCPRCVPPLCVLPRLALPCLASPRLASRRVRNHEEPSLLRSPGAQGPLRCAPPEGKGVSRSGLHSGLGGANCVSPSRGVSL